MNSQHINSLLSNIKFKNQCPQKNCKYVSSWKKFSCWIKISFFFSKVFSWAMKLQIKSLKTHTSNEHYLFFLPTTKKHEKLSFPSFDWQRLMKTLTMLKILSANTWNAPKKKHLGVKFMPCTPSMLMDFHNLQGWHTSNEIITIHLSN